METFLRVESSQADEVTSICPLLTPSPEQTPPTNDLINPLPETNPNDYAVGKELVTILQQVQAENEISPANSASSSSSALAEPACTQLLGHRANYLHVGKEEQIVAEETNGKTQALQLTFRNPPDNYFFMSWNWPLVRKISLWLYLSTLVAMAALVIAMISSLPNKCNPDKEWYQGTVFYEVFPASFSDSNNNKVGDFNGMSQNVDYFVSLGVRAVRLNSIFHTSRYPEDYKNVTTLLKVAPQLGSIDDFEGLVSNFHSKNISLILDLPVFPVVKELLTHYERSDDLLNHTHVEKKSVRGHIEEALFFWATKGVDGFYLKNLEYFSEDPHLVKNLRHWKKIIGPSKIFIISESVLYNFMSTPSKGILNHVDLVDIRLHIEKGVKEISKQIETIQNGTLFSSADMPWIHWSTGGPTSARLADILPYGNATLGATLLQLMLPGTPSIFYGNEYGMTEVVDTDKRIDDIDLHVLGAMVWPDKLDEVPSWLHGRSSYSGIDQIALISKMITLRGQSPSIYINSICKEGNFKANVEVKYSSDDLLVIQRWYPRRKSFVVVSNLGKVERRADLSTLLYSGEVMVGPRTDSKPSSISFKDISLWPGESVVILLN